MQIHIATSTGTGETTLSAFDAALYNAGIANKNLILLSSVIPPYSELVLHDTKLPTDALPGEWGDRLYVVMAQQRADIPGEQAWAGIGWVQDSRTKKGLFVEHEGPTEGSVRGDIRASLTDLMTTRGVDFGDIHMVISGATCAGKPVCAMAVATYQVSDWFNLARFVGLNTAELVGAPA